MLAGTLGYLLGSARNEGTARLGKVVFASIGLSSIVLFHVFALGLRVMVGSSLTVTGLQFFLNSTTHMINAIFSQYVWYVAAVLAVSLVIATGVAVLVRRFSRAPLLVRSFEVWASFSMTVFALLALLAPIPTRYTRGMAKTSTEVALFSSIGGSSRSDRFTDDSFARLSDDALQSPKLSAHGGWVASTHELRDPPNVILISLESVGANHVGFLGYPRPVTPHMDRIAAGSLVFSRAYTTATHSNYAQMAVLSSLFPRRGRALDMYTRLDYPRHLLHDLTASLGYDNAMISSQDQSWQGMQRFQTTDTPNYFHHAPDHQGEHLDMVTEDIAPDEETVKHAIRWIDQQRGERFALYVNLQSTHFPYPIPVTAARPFTPYEPKGTFNYVVWEKDDLPAIINRFDNSLAYVDQQVGALFDALAERGMLDDTVFVVTSDHGEMFFEHDTVTHGRTLYEEETRVPLLVHYPRWLEPRVSDEAVSTLDVLPTILDLLGTAPHPGLQGESIAWSGVGASRQAAVFLNIQGYKHADAIVCMPYKLVFDPDSEESSLYDLARDPHEREDIARRSPDVTLALETVLLAQLDAQERYHADESEGEELRADRFAPLMLPCPELDGSLLAR